MGETRLLKLTNAPFPFLNLLPERYLQTTTYYVVLEKSPVSFFKLTLMTKLTFTLTSSKVQKSTNLLIKCYSSTGSLERWTFFPGRFFFAFRIGQVTAISAKSQDPGCLKLLWIVLYPAPDVKNPHHELTSSKAHRLILGCLSCQSFLKDIHKTLQNHFSVESNAQISDVALSSKLEA